MTTKQEITLCGMLCDEMIKHGWKMADGASDRDLVYAPIVVMVGLRRTAEGGDVDGIANYNLALMDVRAPSFMPGGLIGHCLQQATQAARGEEVDGAETRQNTIAGNTGMPVAENSQDEGEAVN